jgi:hypothetical protein
MQNLEKSHNCKKIVQNFVFSTKIVLQEALRRMNMAKNSLVFLVMIFFWIVLYGISIVIAAIEYEEQQINWKVLKKDGVKTFLRSKITWKSIFPYCVVLLPQLFPPYHSILDTAMWFLFFLILTKILVSCVRNQ